LEVIDPATALWSGNDPQRIDESVSLRQQIAHADAFIVVTPEYNHGYPAPLKALIDSVGSEWHAKPVAFVSYGGVSGGLRAVEQLRQVFAELHTVTVRDGERFSSAWDQFDPGGMLTTPERAQKSMAVMLARLHWWAVALRTARNAMPFTQAA
jgi:NAD(P)H-dependent FMN reductase